VAAGTRHPEPGEFLLGAEDSASMSLTERVDTVLEALEIAHLRDSNVTELAYGTRRKIELARALVMHPRLLLLDEPAAGLRRLRGHGLTVVLVEHQMDLVSSVCDSLTVLDFGRVICEGRPKDVVEDRNVLEAYLGVPEEAA
jgi:branched-chain amino acid transport system permease protein